MALSMQWWTKKGKKGTTTTQHSQIVFIRFIHILYSYASACWPSTIFCLASMYVVNIFQDPNAIEHETVAPGDMYAVVDKPTKGSKKNKGGHDIVPPTGNEGVSVSREV